MLGYNAEKVRKAPVTVIFAADKGNLKTSYCIDCLHEGNHIYPFVLYFTAPPDPSRLTRKLMKLETDNGAHPGYVASLPANISFLLNHKGWLSSSIKQLATHLLSPLKAAPVIKSDSIEWSVKNTSFAAQTFMLAAAANGLATAAMEGFDERRLCFQLGIPIQEYTIPVVISLGYPAASGSETAMTSSNDSALEEQTLKPKVRFPMDDVCFSDRFGKKLDIE
jgi:nitroreductase